MINLIILMLSIFMNAALPDASILEQQAPEKFKAKFTTTKGTFTIEFYREWSPKAVDRAYQLITSGYYDDNAIFRVVGGFVAQFGINNDPAISNWWKEKPVDDEPVKVSNERGTISFARGGPKSRTSQLFINFGNNSNLDDYNAAGVIGYPPIGKVLEGMDVVDNLYSGYGEAPSQKQGEIMAKGNIVLKDKFPKLDYIIKVEIIN